MGLGFRKIKLFMENTLAYYDATTITSVKSFKAQPLAAIIKHFCTYIFLRNDSEGLHMGLHS
jgi:hypothetical protein